MAPLFFRVLNAWVLRPRKISALARSTWPLLWGCAGEALQMWVPMSSQYSTKVWLVNCVPLSLIYGMVLWIGTRFPWWTWQWSVCRFRWPALPLAIWWTCQWQRRRSGDLRVPWESVLQCPNPIPRMAKIREWCIEIMSAAMFASHRTGKWYWWINQGKVSALPHHIKSFATIHRYWIWIKIKVYQIKISYWMLYYCKSITKN